MAAQMIDETTTIEEGLAIVKKAEETQTHYHTKHARRMVHAVDLGCQGFQCGRHCLPNQLEVKQLKREATEKRNTKKFQ